jgi:hypothetical protein
MCKYSDDTRRNEQGQVVIVVALGISIFLIGVIGFGTDYTKLWFHRPVITAY